MVSKTNGNVSASIDFGGGNIKIDISKGDVVKIKEYVKSHRYTNKTILKLDCGFKNKAGGPATVKLVLQAHNPNAKVAAGKGGDEDVV